MPVEWPLAASAADRPVDPARPHAGRDRLPTAMADFFLDEASRLTDEERALMAAMLRSLVLEIADELIAELPPLLGAQDRTGCATACTGSFGTPGCWNGEGWLACCFAGRTNNSFPGMRIAASRSLARSSVTRIARSPRRPWR